MLLLLIVALVFAAEASLIVAIVVVGLRHLARLQRELEEMVAYQRQPAEKPRWWQRD